MKRKAFAQRSTSPSGPSSPRAAHSATASPSSAEKRGSDAGGTSPAYSTLGPCEGKWLPFPAASARGGEDSRGSARRDSAWQR